MAKRCPVCDNEFDDNYINCPIDGTALRMNRNNNPEQSASNSTLSNSHPVKNSRSKGPYVEGTVRNFHEDVIKPSFIKQWFVSLIKGCHFVNDGSINTFDIVENDGEVHSVIVYGKILSGRFHNHSLVRVYGKYDSSNTVVAKRIDNLGSNSNVRINSPLSNISVWILTLLFITSLYYLFFMVDYGRLLNDITETLYITLMSILSAIFPLIFLLFIGWFFFKKIFR